MLAVIVRRGSARLVALGDFEAAAEAARRLNADLDTLAGRRLPARLEAVIRESIRHQTEVLTAEIIAPLRSSLGDDGVVFVPAGALASIPWNMLPGLRGRPVTVCPSASSWLAAWRRGQPPRTPATRAQPRRCWSRDRIWSTRPARSPRSPRSTRAAARCSAERPP